MRSKFCDERRMAKGETQPNSVTGIKNKRSVAMNEPPATGALSVSTPLTAHKRIGRDTAGINPTVNAAQHTS